MEIKIKSLNITFNSDKNNYNSPMPNDSLIEGHMCVAIKDKVNGVLLINTEQNTTMDGLSSKIKDKIVSVLREIEEELNQTK